MNRYVCIHGHFYQPPRENPWLEEIELQDSAYPYHDWNQKITAECYAPNTASRMLDDNKKIIDIVNNYTTISFNFGPTLLSWLQRNSPGTYSKILEADKESQKLFSGHGSALAQCYNHLIMPLANSRDKLTQVLWGIKDFEYRFARKPEGMWLPETAVDLETLEILAQQEIKFTILSPQQVKKIRKIGEKEWQDVTNQSIDPKMPYSCKLASGKTISLFFFDSPISKDIAFGNLLNNGEVFAKRMTNAFVAPDYPQIVHIATDGETFGHHHHYGDMALTYCLYFIDNNNLARITVYGEFLEKFPPTHEVEIFENSSWSCVHGIERWRSNCGCNSGMRHGWRQEWRGPLREAMNWVRDNLINLFEQQMSAYVNEPWKMRDEYIQVILDRSIENVEGFLSKHANKELSKADKIKILKLLEMQRNAMLMFTSCGWFFDEISGIETTQIIHYAARAIHLAQELSGINLEDEFINLLSRAPSNIVELVNGAHVYNLFIKPAVLDLLRVGVHYAVSSLFENYPEKTKIYSYTVEKQTYDRSEIGKQTLSIGRAHISSDITWEEKDIYFAVLHLGDHNLMSGIHEYTDENSFQKMSQEIKEIFPKGDISATIHSIEKYFENEIYSLIYLFKDEQRKVLNQVLCSTIEDIEVVLRQINENYYPAIQMMRQMHMPLPRALATIVELILDTDLRQALENDKIDANRLQKLVQEYRKWALDIDRTTLGFIASNKINSIMENFNRNIRDYSLMESAINILSILKPMALYLNLWKSQNIYFNIGKQLYHKTKEKADAGDNEAVKWVEHFDNLGAYLEVNPEIYSEEGIN